MRTAGFLVLSLWLTAPIALAQPWTFEPIGSQDGLPHNTVNALLQDARGFLWIGTADGLARYDGRRFEVYRRRAGQVGALASNTIQALAQTPDGDLWLGTSAGVCRLEDEAAGRFTCTAPQLDVMRLLYVEGTIWAATIDGVWRLDPQTQTFGAIEFADEYLKYGPSERWFALAAVEEARLVIAIGETGKGDHRRYHYAPDTHRLTLDTDVSLPPETVGFFAMDGVSMVFSLAWLGLSPWPLPEGTCLEASPARGMSAGRSGSGASMPCTAGRAQIIQAVPLVASSPLANAALAVFMDWSGLYVVHVPGVEGAARQRVLIA